MRVKLMGSSEEIGWLKEHDDPSLMKTMRQPGCKLLVLGVQHRSVANTIPSYDPAYHEVTRTSEGLLITALSDHCTRRSWIERDHGELLTLSLSQGRLLIVLAVVLTVLFLTAIAAIIVFGI